MITMVFSGIYQYNAQRVFDELRLSTKSTSTDKILKDLIKKGLVFMRQYHYLTQIDLKMWLYPQLMANADSVAIARKLQNIKTSDSWTRPALIPLGNYLKHGFLGLPIQPSELRHQLQERQVNFGEFTTRMIANPSYDKALLANTEAFGILWNELVYTSEQQFENFGAIKSFLNRVPEELLPKHMKPITLSKILLWEGKLVESHKLIENIYSTESLLIASAIALYSGQYELAAKSFEAARVTDSEGNKMTKTDFLFYDEFYYWIIPLIYPALVNVKKTDTFINKALKDREGFLKVLLPVLYLAKKDFQAAEQQLNYGALAQWEGNARKNFYSVIKLLTIYMVHGAWTAKQAEIAEQCAEALKQNSQFLLLNELLDVFTLSGRETPKHLMLPNHVKLPPSLVARIEKQEKWDITLDGLLTLLSVPAANGKPKAEGNSRVAYFIDFKKRLIQPVLQTRGAKGWTNGRNISLTRFREQTVDGLTDQDRQVAKSMSVSSNYYGTKEYYISFDKAIGELCNHPYLFLMENSNVPLELVKGQPELVTEETAKGIRLKTNLPDTEHTSYVVKETQTRYKVITLNATQQKAVAMLGQGLLIPKQGKEKLLRTISQMSGIMTVQSNLSGAPVEAKAVEADPRLRVQIVPIGDGLKAEIFVKPLGAVPPYLKPGKGGKGVFGDIDGEKVHALRDTKREQDYLEIVANDLAERVDADLADDAVLFDDPYACLDLLETMQRHADIAVVEWPDGERFKVKRSASFADLHLRVSGKGQWFELDGELTVDNDTVLSIKQLLGMARNAKGRFLELSANEFLAISEELRKQLLDLESMVTIDKDKVSLHSLAAHGMDDLAKQSASFKTDKHWKDLKKKIESADKLNLDVPVTLDAELRPYQEEGFRWMAKLHAWGAGACLADDMGLGKTLQAIAMMLRLAENGPVLVVCPASLVPNWCGELQKFAPTLNPIVLRNYNREETFQSLGAFDVLVTTYGLLQSEEERFSKTPWAMAVLDEAHAIKNALSKSSKAAMHLQASFKLVLTGTPIQNHLGELWNLFQFCNTGLLGSLSNFTERYVKTDDTTRKTHLKKLISPFILRRTKNKVLDELPAKTEITQSIELSEAEMAFYEALRLQAIENLESGEGTNGAQHLQALAEITKLRLACCHTSLVNKEIHLPSSKLDAFFEIIEELRENKHRALVFSQFVGHLALVRQLLDKHKIAYQYLDGSTPIPERQASVKAFQSGKGDLFLISLKAGGLGLNLTAADYVIHLDPWWNPAIEDQASDRAHRMGQTRPVTIYRLVAKNTIEEKIVKLHATKRDLADSLLEGTDQSSKLSTADLLELLKSR